MHEQNRFKESLSLLKKCLIFLDLALVTAAFILSYKIRDSLVLIYGVDVIREIYPFERYLNLIPLVLGSWGISLYFFGIYQSFRTLTTSEALFDISKAGVSPTFF